jgi:two-component system response regulator RegX3
MARILLVNDEPDLLQMCRIVLEADGYSVDVATDVSRVVDLAANGADMVLLDLVMPGTSGEAVFRSLRESPKTKEKPVVIMSALDDVVERAHAIGASGVLPKPFTPEALLETIHRTLDGAGRAATTGTEAAEN